MVLRSSNNFPQNPKKFLCEYWPRMIPVHLELFTFFENVKNNVEVSKFFFSEIHFCLAWKVILHAILHQKLFLICLTLELPGDSRVDWFGVIKLSPLTFCYKWNVQKFWSKLEVIDRANSGHWSVLCCIFYEKKRWSVACLPFRMSSLTISNKKFFFQKSGH